MARIRTPLPPLSAEDGLVTADRLARAAMLEFNEAGFAGTDSNRIARRAGFAPQTFYRWYRDKTEVFTKVYAQWQQQEVEMLQQLLAKRASDLKVAKALAEHHAAFLRFRRSLRQLAIEDERVREARAASRLRQIEFIRSLHAGKATVEFVALNLLQIERLADALCEGEFADIGVNEDAALAAIATLIATLRPRQ